MSWIALTDLSDAAFNIRGIGVPRNAPGARGPVATDELLPRGTLMVEFRANIAPDRPQTLLTFHLDEGWPRAMRLRLDASGRLSLTLTQGKARSEAALDMPVPPQGARLRVSYAWAAPQRVARLSVERVDEGRIFQAMAYDPLPLPATDVKAIMRNDRATAISKDVGFVAFSDEIEPIGFATGLTKGTPVETSAGPVPVEQLQLGDMVTTATAGPQPVRWIGKRRVPALGGFRPVRFCAPHFGLARDLVLAPAHRLRITAAPNEPLRITAAPNEPLRITPAPNDDATLLSAEQLTDGRRVRQDNRHRLVTYYQVLLDMHDCLLHGGLWAESLFVGTIARHPALAQSTVLANMPLSAIPQHRPFARKHLSTAETRNVMTAFATG